MPFRLPSKRKIADYLTPPLFKKLRAKKAAQMQQITELERISRLNRP